jgi:hypothetical protein
MLDYSTNRSPLLSLRDDEDSAEGGINPLGFYSIADQLASDFLAPGVRERQRRIRFVTISAVSAWICADFGEDEIAADGVSEPWQVLEWYVVEGLVRGANDDLDERGLPGRDKAARARKDGLPLSAKIYLKTPSVFGFHGVYRSLARSLDIVNSTGILAETGIELLRAWEKDQGLAGFYSGNGENGGRYRNLLRDAVRDGLREGAVSRPSRWQGWVEIIQHLRHSQVGRYEKRVLRSALRGKENAPDPKFRGHLLDYLISEPGRRAWRASKGSERSFHEAFHRDCKEKGLRDLLGSILAFESFSRLLQDAFEDALSEMARCTKGASPGEMAKRRPVDLAARKTWDLARDVADRLGAFGLSGDFQRVFGTLSEARDPDDWIVALLEHHTRIQREKPPHGKAPWCERLDNGRWVVRPLYRPEAGDGNQRDYVNRYRTGPLWSFAKDLGLV